VSWQPAAVPVAAALAAGSVLLLVPGPHRLRGGSPAKGIRHPGRWVSAGYLVAAAGLLAAVDGMQLALALIVLGASGAALGLLRRARRARAADRRAALVVEVCEALAGELRAGQTFVDGLGHCVDVWPEFAPVAAAGRLGADVPAALRTLAEKPGAEGVAEVASAWHVAARSGAGLAAALSQVAVTARARQSTQGLVRAELASAQATARLVAVLPVASLAMSAGIGGNPWHFLFRTPAGLGCLALGAAFAFAGLLWIDRIAAAVLRG
jgi:tight adherence protein B